MTGTGECEAFSLAIAFAQNSLLYHWGFYLLLFKFTFYLTILIDYTICLMVITVASFNEYLLQAVHCSGWFTALSSSSSQPYSIGETDRYYHPLITDEENENKKDKVIRAVPHIWWLSWPWARTGNSTVCVPPMKNTVCNHYWEILRKAVNNVSYVNVCPEYQTQTQCSKIPIRHYLFMNSQGEPHLLPQLK